ncbi:MAG TPA: phospholipid carrier-dependent glycosyltransferase [Polyangia bacterium]
MKRAAQWFRDTTSSIRGDAPLAVIVVATLVVGVYLRLYDIHLPTFLRWDEHHYVNVARSYLAREYNTDDHPPFGKLIMFGFMRVLGDNPIGWRMASEVFGFINIGLAAWAAWAVFRSRRAGVLAASFVAIDGFFIAYSRAALLDGMIVAALVFYCQSAAALVLTGKSGSLLAVIAENRKLIKHHLSYTVVHPNSSHWYTWFIPIRPILLRRDVDADQTARALLTLGNPLLWWASTVAVLGGLVVLARVGPRRLWEMVQAHGGASSGRAAGAEGQAPRDAGGRPGEGGVLAVQDRAAWIFGILLGWAGPLAFWVPSLRDAYIYHYFPSYTFALILLAGFTDRFYDRRRLATLAAILVVVEVSMFYAPVWGEFPISEAALHVRLFPFWR